MEKTKVIAEIGINYAYGTDRDKFLTNAKKLIDVAIVAGCDWVKFQKRSPDHCVPEEQKNLTKSVPWRTEPTTYIQYKHDVEFTYHEWKSLYAYCEDKPIGLFASVWDKQSVEFMCQFEDQIAKIPSALITDIDLCSYARDHFDHMIISTGMSTEAEVVRCMKAIQPDIVMHTNSSYPSSVDELRLEYITYLKNKYGHDTSIGYSGHEYGLITTMAAVTLGATWIERHITLDRTNWGSDQSSSVEPSGLMKLVKGIRDIEKAMGGNEERKVLGSELSKRKSLRGE
jgi:N-acetylneuraminate synthase